MSKTEVSGKQVKDGSIELVDLSTGLASTISGKADSSSLATVATSGSYADLTNKPSLFSGSYSDLTNKPSLFSGAYSDLTGKPTLATVATSGSYNDLSNKPSLFDGSYNNLTDKPSLFSGSYADLSNKPSIPSNIDDLSDVTITTPSNTQVLQYNGSAWVNAAAPQGFSGAYSDLTGKPSLATVATSGSYTDLTNKPSMISTLNTLTGATQTFATGNSGTDFAISSSGTTHTFNIPDASATARGVVTTGAQTLAGVKTFSSAPNLWYHWAISRQSSNIFLFIINITHYLLMYFLVVKNFLFEKHSF